MMNQTSGAIINQLFVAARDHESNGKAKLASAIYDRKKLIAYGFNDYLKSHPYQKKFGNNEDCCFLHSEISCILNAKREVNDLRGLTIYIARAKKSGKRWVTGMSRPCAGCSKALEYEGLKEVYFTLDEKGIGYDRLD